MKRVWPTRSTTLARTCAAIAVLGLLTAACSNAPTGSTGGLGTDGASGSGAPADSTPPDAGGAGSVPGASPSGPVIGHVGDKLEFIGFGGLSQLDATLVKIFDPAIPADKSTTPMPAGAHWVGVEITTDNPHPAGESSVVDATASDGSILNTLDDYQGFSRPLGAFQGCTETSGSEEDAQPFTHCEAFAVLDGQVLTKVGVKIGGAEIYSSLVPTDQAVWTVP